MSTSEIPEFDPIDFEAQQVEEHRALGHAAMGIVARGGNPISESPRLPGKISLDSAISYRMIWERKSNDAINSVLSAPGSGWEEISKFYDSTINAYKEKNKQKLIKVPKTEEERIAMMQQLEPIVSDPNLVAGLQQNLVKLNQRLQKIDPRFSVFTHPKTKRIAEFLNREAGSQAGLFTSGGQELQMGVAGRATQHALEFTEGATDFLAHIGNLAAFPVKGLWSVGADSIKLMGGPDLSPNMTNWIVDKDGTVHNNGSKVPGFVDLASSMWAAAWNKRTSDVIDQVEEARSMDQQTRSNLMGMSLGISRLAGAGIGFGGPAGKVMGIGKAAGANVMVKGFDMFAKGVAKSSPRFMKMMEHMGAGTGGMLANGLTEAGAYGQVEGYGKAFMHGFVFGLPMMVMGAAGGRLDYFLKHRKNIPGAVSAAAGSMVEGLGFGTMELLAPDLMPSAWGFVKDPNEATWSVYARNVGGFLLSSIMMRGRTPNPARDPEMFHMERNLARQRAAEGVAEGKVGAEALPPGADVETVRRYGEVSKQLRKTASPEESQKLQAEARDLEARMDDGERQATESKVRQETAETEATKRVTETEDALREERMRVLKEAAEDVERPPAERIAANKRLKALEDQGKGKEVGPEGQRVEFRDSTTSLGKKEWVLRDKEGNVIGEGSWVESNGGKTAEIVGAEISEAHQNKQIYRKIRAEIGMRYENVISRISQTEAAKKSAAAAESMVAAMKASGPTVEAIKPGREGPSGRMEKALGSLENPPTQWVMPAEGAVSRRASDIFKEMEGRPEDPVQVPMRVGKITLKGALGVFKNNENLVRTEEGRNIATGSHEWAHAMHRHILRSGKGKGFTVAAENQLNEFLRNDPAVREDINRMLANYPGKLTQSQVMKEAWAEWNARDMLNEAGLRAEFPALSKQIDAFLNQPANVRFKMQKERIKRKVYEYHAQGSLSRVRQSIVRESDEPTETELATSVGKVKKALLKIEYEMYDDAAYLKASMEKWAKAVGKDVKDINIMDNPVRMRDVHKMTATKIAFDMVNDGIRLGDTKTPGPKKIFEGMQMDAPKIVHVDELGNVVDEGGKPISGKAKVIEDFTTYLVARRNLELMREREVTLPTGEKKKVPGKKTQLPFNDYEHARLVMEAQYPEFKQKAAELKQWTDSLLDWVAESEGLGVEESKRIKEAYGVYIPFYRVIEGPRAHGGGRGVAERGTGLGRIKGSTFEIRDPLVALQEVAQTLVARAHSNQIIGSLYRLSMAHEMGALATVIPRSKVPTDHPINQLLEKIEKGLSPKAREEFERNSGNSIEDVFGQLIAADKLSPGLITTFMQKVQATGERSVIAFTPRMSEAEISRLEAEGANRDVLERQNGKVQWLEVDTAAYELLMGINDVSPNNTLLSNTATRAARDMVRLFATGLSPGFTIANAIRDMASEPIFSKSGKFRPLGGVAKWANGLYLYHFSPQARAMYEESGVKTATFHNEAQRRWLAGQPSARTQIGRVWDYLKHNVSKIETLLSHPENYLRIAEQQDVYKAAIKAGKSEREARLLGAEGAKEITVNFARAGAFARQMNQAVPYVNASLQGQRKTWRALNGSEGSTPAERNKMRAMAVANGIAQLTVPTLLLYWLNHDQEWYQDLPSWHKARYWSIRLGGQTISAPKPFELGTLFATIPEWLASQFYEDDVPIDIEPEVFGLGFPYMNSIVDLMPALIKPTIETIVNYDSFRGREIVPSWMEESRVPTEQKTSMTTKAAVAIGELLGASPAKVQHWLGATTAGGSTALFRFIDDVTSGDVMTAFSAPNPLKRFTRQTPHRQSRFVDKLYDLGVDLQQKSGSDVITSEETDLLHRVNAAKREISDIRKRQRSGDLTTEEADRMAYEIARPIIESNK